MAKRITRIVLTGGPAAGKTVPLGGETPLQRDENGHVDPATIADPNDFQDWDDMGCRG